MGTRIHNGGHEKLKNFIRLLPVKIICFILCVVCLITTVASVLGIWLMLDMGIYTRTEDYVFTEISTDILRGDAYNIMFYSFEDDADYLGIDHYFSAQVTNIRFRVLTHENEILQTNAPLNPDAWKTWNSYYFRVTEIDGERYIHNLNKSEAAAFEDQTQIYTLDMYLDAGLPMQDEYALVSWLLHTAYNLRYGVFIIAGASVLLWIVSFVILLCAAGRKPNSDEIHPGAITKLPFDLVLGVLCLIVFCSLYFLDGVSHTGDIDTLMLIGAFCLAGFMVFLWFCMDMIVRIKQKNLRKNTLVWKICKLAVNFIKWICKGTKTVIRNLPLVWKAIVLVLVNGAIDFFLLILLLDYRGYVGFFVFNVWALKSVAFSILLIYAAIVMKKLQKGGKALAEGDLAYKVDTKRMFWDFKHHGEDLNRISDGMAVAVEQRLKSERTKAELVTNVSHDIKTPLTSIINYASLISEEKCDNEKHAEYSRVLIRRSEHLKRLLEDLVEISKATTGNLEVQLMPCSAQVLLSQVAGEFEQRCIDAGLELITQSPESNITIMADSRRIWRVFENLMNNACKYSLCGSRVYITLEKIEGEAVFVFKNTSKSALNISPDELMERFVRGDTSRNTEGNGLGLSIASSLTQLQNGKMELTIDGDLFKVALRFPAI